MKKNKQFSLLSLMLCLLILIPSFIFPSYAQESTASHSNINVSENPTEADLKRSYKVFIDDFEETSSTRSPYGKATALILEKEFSTAPGAPISGACCLSVPGDLLSGEEKGVTITPETPLSLSAAQSLCFAASCERAAGITGYFVKILLKTEKETLQASVEIQPDKWNAVYLPLDQMKSRAGITQIQISFYVTADSAASYTGAFRMDFMCGSGISGSAATLPYLTTSFTATNGTLTFGEEYLRFKVKGSAPALQTAELSYDTKGNANTVALTIKNGSSATRATLYYICGEGETEFREDYASTVAIEAKSGIQTYYFSLDSGIAKNTILSKIKIVFSGRLDGNIDIYGIRLTSMYLPYSTIGTIEHCETDGEIIEIDGSLDTYPTAEATLDLYRLSPYMDETRLSEYRLSPYRSIKKSRDFSFEIPIYDGDICNLDYKYYVVLQSAAGVKAVDTPKYTSNIQSISEGSAHIDPLTIKGLQPQFIYDAKSMNIRQAVLSVPIYSLFSQEETDYAVSLEGKTVWFDAEKVNELERKIHALTNDGIACYLRIVNPKSDTYFYKITAHPAASENAAGAMPNIASDAASVYYRAFFEFLTKRFSSAEHGIINGYILGDALNLPEKESIGAANLKTASEYIAALYISAQNTARRYNSALFVYLAAAAQLHSESSCEETDVYRLYEFITSVSGKVRKESGCSVSLALETDSADKEDTLSVHDTDAVYRLLESGARMIVLEKGFSSAENEENAVIGYADAFFTLAQKSYIDAFILLNHTDTSTEKNGLLQYQAAESDSLPRYTPKQSYCALFSGIDSADFAAAAKQYLSSLSDSERAALEKKFTEMHLPENSTVQGSLRITQKETEVLQKLCDFSTAESLSQFKKSDFCLNLSYDAIKEVPALTAAFNGEYGRLSLLCKDTDAGSRQLFLRLMLDYLPENIGTVLLSVRLKSEDGEVTAETAIPGNEYVTLVFDTDDAVKSFDEIEITFRAPEYSALGSPRLSVSEIYFGKELQADVSQTPESDFTASISETAENQESAGDFPISTVWLIIAGGALLLFAAFGIVLAILNRRSAHTKK